MRFRGRKCDGGAIMVFGLLLQLTGVVAFCSSALFSASRLPSDVLFTSRTTALNAKAGPPIESNQWLREYCIASGEVINPYEVLKVSRAASTKEVRQSYISLSRRYHPDGARQKKILPGRCSNWDEVRDEWERVKLSYEILKHPLRRKRYDRHEAIADPGAAFKRAAKDAAVTSIVKLGEGVFSFGAFAVTTIAEKVQKQSQTQEANNY